MQKQGPRLPLELQFGEDLVIVNKPAGFSTHAADPGRPGIAEILEQELMARGMANKVHVVHRLDKTTTGTLLFATSAQKAAELFTVFKNQQVKKRYVFLTRSRAEENEFHVFSKIEKAGDKVRSTPCSQAEANAETVFRKDKINAFFQRWEAIPKTGKLHQIRAHAAQAGIPILGDTLYGGEAYPHLCLHAEKLEIPGVGRWSTFPPIFIERMGLLRDSQLAAWLSAIDRRQRLYNFPSSATGALRLCHRENRLPFRADLYGPMIWAYWYEEAEPSPTDLERWELIAGLLRRKVIVMKMENRGRNPQAPKRWSFLPHVPGGVEGVSPGNTFVGEPINPKAWTATENGLIFELREEQGLSPGLFLDQRRHRHWLRANCEGLRVLNLFAYTCSFSLCAAVGGASEVASVDLNKTFLEWGKKNFTWNGFPAQSDKFLFFAQDSLRFLQQTAKKNKKYDCIICDPPSFSRSDKKVWKIDRDLPELLQACWAVLEKGGLLYCSSNYEKWDQQAFEKTVLAGVGRDAEPVETSPPDWDYESPGQEPLLKFCWLRKGSK